MRYKADFLRRLLDQLESRYRDVVCAISPHGERGDGYVAIDGLEVRIAVGALNSVLTEIKKLK